jgi:NADPH:quinone reductase
MKAIVCRAFGSVDQLDYIDVPPRPIGPHEVRVRVHAAGVNFPDSLKVEGRHQIKPELPWIPGSETGGVVVAVGAQVQGLHAGDHVMAVSEARGGGFAEEIVLDARRVFALPDSMTFEEAAATPVVYGTTMYALKQRGRIAPGEWLLVLGAAGGVGLAAVQLGRALGARVIAAASTEEKRALCLAHGAQAAIDYTREGWRDEVKALTGGRGVNLVYDPVGGDAFDEAVRCMAFDGRYLVIGFTSGRIPSIQVNYPLVKGFDILGVRYDVWRDACWQEARANLQEVLELCEQGRLRPLVTATYPLARAVEAMRDVTSRKITGKVVLVNG